MISSPAPAGAALGFALSVVADCEPGGRRHGPRHRPALERPDARHRGAAAPL